MDALMLFVHVPKTAGTMVREMALAEYTSREVWTVAPFAAGEDGRFARLDEAHKHKLRAIVGHMVYGWHELLAPSQPCQYVTMLRDPAERVLSLHALASASGDRPLSLLGYLATVRMADNGMVRQLCGADRFGSDMELPLGAITSTHLAAACDNLARCAVVGIAERFEAFAAAMRRAFGWHAQPARVNVTTWPRRSRSSLSRQERRAIDQATHLDAALYDHAQRMSV